MSIRHTQPHTVKHKLCIKRNKNRPILYLVSYGGFIINGYFERILHLDITSRGKWEHEQEMEGRAEEWRTEMTRQMVDWRLSLWEETPGSQLEEGTATLRQLEDQSKLVIFDHDF